MKKFEVPLNLMVQFAEMMEDQRIENTVLGVSIFGDIEMLISYKREHLTILKKITDMIEEHNKNRADTFFKRIVKKAIEMQTKINISQP